MNQAVNNEDSSLQKPVTLRRTLGAVGGNLAVLLVSTLAGMINVKICLHFLGRADYGIVLLVGTVSGWMWLGDLGFGTAIRQRVTVLLAQSRADEAARTVSSGALFYSLMGAVLVALFIALHAAGATTLLIKDDGVNVDRARSLLFFGVMLFLCMFPLQGLQSLLLARNDFFAHNLFATAQAGLRPVMTWVVLSISASLPVYFMAIAAYQATMAILRYLYAIRCVPQLRVRPRLASWALVKSLAAPSVLFSVISFGYVVVYQTSNAIISSMIGLAAIPAYAAAFSLFSTLRSLCVTSGDVLFPVAGILDSQGQHERLQRYVEVNARISMTLAVLGGAGLAFFGEGVIGAWLGPDLNPGRGTLLAFAALLPVATIVNTATRSVCGVGRHHRQAAILVVEVALNLVISIVLAARLGILGVALGTLIARALVTWPYLMDGAAQLRLDLKHLLATAVVPNAALGGVLFAAGSLVGARSAMPLPTLLAWTGSYAAVCAVIFVAMTPAEFRRKVLAALAERSFGVKAVRAADPSED